MISFGGVRAKNVLTPYKHVPFKCIYLGQKTVLCSKILHIYPQTIGDKVIPNFVSCDAFHFIPDLTPLGDLDCDAAQCAYIIGNCKCVVIYHQHAILYS